MGNLLLNPLISTVAIWEKRKSKKLKYNRCVVRILDLLRKHNIVMNLIWVPTDRQVSFV